MFPALANDPNLFNLLSPEVFMRWILIPQCTILLILEDRSFVNHNLMTTKAFNLMRTSVNYGYHWFHTGWMCSAHLDCVLAI